MPLQAQAVQIKWCNKNGPGRFEKSAGLCKKSKSKKMKTQNSKSKSSMKGNLIQCRKLFSADA